MPRRWLGLVVGSDCVTVVDAEVPKTGALIIQGDNSWKLQSGNRPAAYGVLAQQLADYIAENRIYLAVFKASASSRQTISLGHLQAAELRGVLLSAAASVTKVIELPKAHISKTFGKRKVDDYVKDNDFWKDAIDTQIRRGSREAAMVLLAARG